MLELLYVATLGLLAIYGLNSLVLTAIYWLRPRRADTALLESLPGALPVTLPGSLL